MKKRMLMFPAVLLFVILVLFAANKIQQDNGFQSVGGSDRIYGVTQIHADKIMIKHEKNRDIFDYESVITDPVIVQEVLDIYNTMQIRDMSKPLDYSRFFITFYFEEKEIAVWRINSEAMTSGSALGSGNHVIENEDFNYDYFLRLYSDGLSEDVDTP